MSREEIITSTEGRAKAPLDIYQFPPEPGEFTGILTYRAWPPEKAISGLLF